MKFNRKEVDSLFAQPFFKPPTPEQAIDGALIAAARKSSKMIDEATNDEEMTKAIGLLDRVIFEYLRLPQRPIAIVEVKK